MDGVPLTEAVRMVKGLARVQRMTVVILQVVVRSMRLSRTGMTMMGMVTIHP